MGNNDIETAASSASARQVGVGVCVSVCVLEGVWVYASVGHQSKLAPRCLKHLAKERNT